MTEDLIVRRGFDASVAQVWRAWTEGEQVMRWWGPDGFSSPLAEMDVREGGRSLLCMRAPAEWGGQDMYSTWTYTAVEPEQRLAFVHHFADREGNPLDPADLGLPPGIPRETPQVVSFAEAGDGTTELTVSEFGYTTPEARDLSRMGLEQCLDKMAASFAGVPTQPAAATE